MATNETIIGALLRGKAYYLILLDEYLIKLKGGGNCEGDRSKLLCLKKLIRFLQYDVTAGINNDITTEVYRRLMVEIDGFDGDILPLNSSVMIANTTILAGIAGPAGKSAYELAVVNGFVGTIVQWLESLRGLRGNEGKSAYALAVEFAGFVGTVEEWLASLKGEPGNNGELEPYALITNVNSADQALDQKINTLDTNAIHTTGNETKDGTLTLLDPIVIPNAVNNTEGMNYGQGKNLPSIIDFQRNIGKIPGILVTTTGTGKCKEFLRVVPANNYCYAKINVVNSASTVKTFDFATGYDALSTEWSVLTPEVVYMDRNLDFNIEIRKVDAFGPLNFGILVRYRNKSLSSSRAIVSVEFTLELPAVGANFHQFNLLSTPEYDFAGTTNLYGRKLTLNSDGKNWTDTDGRKFLKEGDIKLEAESAFGPAFGPAFGASGNLATQSYVNEKDLVINGRIDNLGTTYQALSQKNVTNGYAGIGADGLINPIFLPLSPGRNTFTVASEAAMLALGSATPTPAAKGDFAIRTDAAATGGEATYVLGDLPAATLANWKKLPNPVGGVTSFNTLIGAVNVTTDNIPEGGALYFTNARVKSYGDTLYATIAHTHGFASITGKPTTLVGYGIIDAEPAFTKNTAFNKNFGQAAGTVVQGNDSRVANGVTAFGWGDHATQRYFKYESASLFGVDANTLAPGRSQFTYALNAPYTGPITHFDANGYGLFFNASYGDGKQIAFRTKNGDNATFNPWYGLWHTGNLSLSATAVASVGVLRDANSDIFARLFRSEYALTQDLPATGFLMGQVNQTTDSFVRPHTQAQVRTFLGLGSNAYSSVGFLPLAGGTLIGALSGTLASFSNKVLGKGTGNDFSTGAFEATGDGATNTVFPTIGFHQPGLYAGSLQLRAANDFRFYKQGSLAFANISAHDGYFSGYVTAVGGAGTSDARYKDIKHFDFDLTQLDTVNYYQFEWNKKISVDDKGRQHWGYMAQEIQEINPHLIMGTEEKLALNKEELLILEVIRLKQRISALEGLSV